MERIFLHCDMNNYFASVEALFNPHLNSIPFAVGGDPKTRHGIILSANQIAKKHHVIAGESIYSASMKCPNLEIIAPNYPRYVEYAKKSRAIYQRFTSNIIPYGLDEAWLIIDSTYEEAVQIAQIILDTIFAELGLSISIGISFNYVFSKLASDQKKPITVYTPFDLASKIWPLPAFELLLVGPKTRSKLKKIGILTIGDLAKANPTRLNELLGKPGITLYQFANGDDHNFNPQVDLNLPFKNISNTITLPVDTKDRQDLEALLYVLSHVVVKRLKNHQLRAKSIGINLKLATFEVINHRSQISSMAQDDLYRDLIYLCNKYYPAGEPIRSVGIYVCDLYKDQGEQLTLPLVFIDDQQIEKVRNYLKEKYGQIEEGE